MHDRQPHDRWTIRPTRRHLLGGGAAFSDVHLWTPHFSDTAGWSDWRYALSIQSPPTPIRSAAARFPF